MEKSGQEQPDTGHMVFPPAQNRENAVTLCSRCHGHVHGVVPDGYIQTPEEVDLAICEYLSDYYAGEWYPYK